MTTCFVAQFRGISLAAADTRLSINDGSGKSAARWDAADLPVQTSSGIDHIFPYEFRKIRQLNRGWAVAAGSYPTGVQMLNLLQRERSATAEQAAEILRTKASAEFEAMRAVPDMGENLYVSRILGTPAAPDRSGVWMAQTVGTPEFTVQTAPEFAMNWPTSIAADEITAAQEAFFSRLNASTSIADMIRAAATLIGSARAAADSSAYAQIGITWQSGETEFQARYVHGHVDELAALTNEEISARWRIVPASLNEVT